MFGNPYMYRENQQPIQNIINTQMPINDMFMAQFVKENEQIENIFVNQKTAFIDLKNKQMKIKEMNGNITTYGLILPKDEKDLKIEFLEKQINELKGMINNGPKNDVTTDNESTQQNGDA